MAVTSSACAPPSSSAACDHPCTLNTESLKLAGRMWWLACGGSQAAPVRGAQHTHTQRLEQRPPGTNAPSTTTCVCQHTNVVSHSRTAPFPRAHAHTHARRDRMQGMLAQHL
jgi:hypothetical protein